MTMTDIPLLSLTAADLMSQPLILIPQEMSMRAAAQKLMTEKVHGAPVVDADGHVGSSRVDLQACKLEYSIVSPK